VSISFRQIDGRPDFLSSRRRAPFVSKECELALGFSLGAVSGSWGRVEAPVTRRLEAQRGPRAKKPRVWLATPEPAVPVQDAAEAAATEEPQEAETAAMTG
jgi:hypothetical protein